MTLRLSAPSKTFLVGEYAVLAGGPALVLNTSPRFELVVQKGETSLAGIPQGSPSWRWLEQRAPLLKNWSVEFKDPHSRAGGFGASGAQFLLSHCLTTFLQSSFERVLSGPVLNDVWNDHQVLSEHKGSGADIFSQSVGGVARVDVGEASADPRSWPYPEISWVIVRTHQKVSTHEHLRELDRGVPALLLRPAAECVEAFGVASAEVFISKMKSFAERLREVQLQAPPTLSLIQLLEKEDWCLMAKGCGALGADTVLFMHPANNREAVMTFLKKQSLQIVATQADLSHGLEMRWTL